MIYLTLAYEFFKIGLFSVGGGMATLPFLMDLTSKYNWFTASELANMVAISESTPGYGRCQYGFLRRIQCRRTSRGYRFYLSPYCSGTHHHRTDCEVFRKLQ